MALMTIILSILSMVIGLGSLVCWIMEIVAAFKNEESPLLGILSIIPCLGLGGLIIGWVKHREWGITQLMMIWSALIVISIVLNIVGMAVGIGAAGAAGDFGAIPGVE